MRDTTQHIAIRLLGWRQNLALLVYISLEDAQLA
jgi:hypothetical protein